MLTESGQLIVTWVIGLAYAAPAVLCLIQTAHEIWTRYRADRERREASPDTYTPQVNVGSIVEGILFSLTPAINAWGAVAVVNDWIGSLRSLWGKLLQLPLVPKK